MQRHVWDIEVEWSRELPVTSPMSESASTAADSSRAIGSVPLPLPPELPSSSPLCWTHPRRPGEARVRPGLGRGGRAPPWGTEGSIDRVVSVFFAVFKIHEKSSQGSKESCSCRFGNSVYRSRPRKQATVGPISARAPRWELPSGGSKGKPRKSSWGLGRFGQATEVVR